MIGPRQHEKEDAQVVALNQEIGRRLREKRESLGLNQAEAGKRIGVGRARYTQIELGVKDIRISNLAEVAHALGVNLGDLLKDL